MLLWIQDDALWITYRRIEDTPNAMDGRKDTRMRYASKGSRVRRGALSLGVSLALVAGCAGGSEEDGSDGASGGDTDPITLTYASYFNADDAYGRSETWWAEEIERRTDGRVRFDMHFSGSLVAQDAMLPAIADGRVDLGAPVEAFWPAELPLSQIASLPFTTSNGEVQSLAFHELYENNEAFRAEFDQQNIEVLWFVPTTPNTLASKTPVVAIEDLNGLRIRTYGTMTNALNGIGAAPASFPLPEVYESIERGVIDGGLTGMELVADLRWYEPAPYVTEIGTGLYTLVYLSINKGTWEGLSQDLKDIIIEVSREATEGTKEIFHEVADRACDDIRESGSEVSVLAEAEVDKWRDAVRDDLIEDWIGQVGAPAEEFLEQYLDAVSRYEAASEHTSAVERCAEQT